MTLIKHVGMISDLPQTLTCLSRLSRTDVTEEGLSDALAYSVSSYFRNGAELDIGDTRRPDVKLVSLPGLKHAGTGKDLYLFFRRRSGRRRDGVEWAGTYVGSRNFLMRYVAKPIPESNSIAKRTGTSFISPQELEKFYDLLFDKECWRVNGDPVPLFRLCSYLKYSFHFAKDYIGALRGGVVYNDTETQLIFSSRLYCKFGYYITMRVTLDDLCTPVAMEIMEPNADITQHGFSQGVDMNSLANIAPFLKEFTFLGEESSFDLFNSKRLNHIVLDRANRLGVLNQELSELDLSLAIRQSISLAVQLSKANPNYIHPMYSLEFNEIQFLIPLFIGFGDMSSPRCALVVRKNDSGVWTLQTVLQIKMAYYNARVVRRPDELWLRSMEGM